MKVRVGFVSNSSSSSFVCIDFGIIKEAYDYLQSDEGQRAFLCQIYPNAEDGFHCVQNDPKTDAWEKEDYWHDLWADGCYRLFGLNKDGYFIRYQFVDRIPYERIMSIRNDLQNTLVNMGFVNPLTKDVFLDYTEEHD
ncbi:MAG: hypothetical protein WC942_11930 [Clostridia bacterium]|jgi:hypothetical protein